MRLMKRVSTVIAVCGAMIMPAQAQYVSTLKNIRVETYFSPRGGATEAISNLIGGATTRVWLAGYGFSSAPIADALAAAQKRGVDVRLVLDSSNKRGRISRAPELRAAGLDVRTTNRYAIMHHKFVIVDQSIVLGSMNFTASGEGRNAENMNVFTEADTLVAVYDQEFLRLHLEAVPLTQL